MRQRSLHQMCCSIGGGNSRGMMQESNGWLAQPLPQYRPRTFIRYAGPAQHRPPRLQLLCARFSPQAGPGSPRSCCHHHLTPSGQQPHCSTPMTPPHRRCKPPQLWWH
eukprot:6005779-Prymnesium_polylepis.1